MLKKDDIVVWWEYTPDGLNYTIGIVDSWIQSWFITVEYTGTEWKERYTKRFSGAYRVRTRGNAIKMVHEDFVIKVGRL